MDQDNREIPVSKFQLTARRKYMIFLYRNNIITSLNLKNKV